MQPLQRLIAVSTLLAVLGLAPAGHADPTRSGVVETIVFTREMGALADRHLRAVEPRGGPSRRLGCSAFGVGSPTVSPNGSIWIESDGSGRRRLTRPLFEDSGPSWSPDGRWIVFARDDQQQTDIYIVRSSGGRPSRLTRTEAFEWAPAWAPGGRLIAFVSERDAGVSQLYVMRPNGSAQRRVFIDTEKHADPVWSPRGGRLAFARGGENAGEIYTVRLDGTNLRRLTLNTVFDGEPDWAVVRR